MIFNVGDRVVYEHETNPLSKFNGSIGVVIESVTSLTRIYWEAGPIVTGFIGHSGAWTVVSANIKPINTEIEYIPTQEGDRDDDI